MDGSDGLSTMYTCIAMVSFSMVWASYPFFDFFSNICLRVGNDGFGLSLYLVVEMYIHYTVHKCNLLRLKLQHTLLE